MSSAGTDRAPALVLVNECRIFATHRAADWWTWFRYANPSGRFEDRVVSLGGNLVAVACDDREHADWLAAHMVDFAGIPKSAVRVEE